MLYEKPFPISHLEELSKLKPILSKNPKEHFEAFELLGGPFSHSKTSELSCMRWDI